jgi:uncharacterized protein (TIGR03435 family)
MTRWTGFSALLCLGFSLLGVPRGEPQSPAFEVAVIKPNRDLPIMQIGPELGHGTLHGAKVTLRRLLAVAYGMMEPRIIGPDWLDKNRFDIMAKSPEGVPDSELQPMLEALLKDRFKLTAHLEAREMPVYYLTVGKGGAKMPVYPARNTGSANPGLDPNLRGFPMMRGTAATSSLAAMMARVVNRPVIDETGLTERYSYFLSYAPLTPQAGDHAPEFGPPDFFTAVQEQLGLKLQPGKDKVDVVIVDHIEQMPTEN